MPRLEDDEIREKILEALSASESGNHVQFTGPAEAGRSRVCPRVSQAGVVRALRVWVEGGGSIDAAPETREPWRDQHDYHYDFRIKIGGIRVYIETRLIEDRMDAPELFIVNIKEADPADQWRERD